MPAYKYKIKKNEFWFFKCSSSGNQYIKRFSESGERFFTKREAELGEVRFLSSLNKKRKDPIYFYDLYDEFRNYLYKRYRNSTATRNLGVFNNHIYPFFENKRISKISNTVVVQLNTYINKLEYKDPKNLFKVGMIWIRFLNSEYSIKLKASNFYKFRSDDIITSLSDYSYYTNDEFNKLLSVIDSAYWKLLFSVLYYYGLRISELRGIRKDHFTKESLLIDRCITNRTSKSGQVVTPTKTKSSVRVFPMFENLYELFKACENDKSEYVFYSFDKNIFTVGESTIRRYLEKFCSLAKIKVIKIHEFRHSCASLLINNGMDSIQVASWLGHSSAAITYKVYVHLFDRRKKEIYNFLDELQKNVYSTYTACFDKKR